MLKEIDQEEKEKKNKSEELQETEVFFNDKVPDSVSLLLDTRLLRAIGLDADSFVDAFTKEQHILERGKPFSKWLEKDCPHDYQMEYLKLHTDYGEEDLSMLNPMEAQSFINIMKKQTKRISAGRRHVLTNIYKIPSNKIPERDIDARRLIRHLKNRRFKYGGA